MARLQLTAVPRRTCRSGVMSTAAHHYGLARRRRSLPRPGAVAAVLVLSACWAAQTTGAHVAVSSAHSRSSTRHDLPPPNTVHVTVDLDGSSAVVRSTPARPSAPTTSEIPIAAPAPFAHSWEECVGSGHAKLALRQDWRDQLALAHTELGFKRVRFHGILDDDVGVLPLPQAAGRLDAAFQMNTTNLDSILDYIHSVGMSPYLEVSFMPSALASGNTTYLAYQANVTPPRNLTLWTGFIAQLASHFVGRFGAAATSEWRFEVWNEPNLVNSLTIGNWTINLGEFWAGNQSQYFDLYAATARALVEGGGPHISVGGPASAFHQWIPEFLAFCGYGEHAGGRAARGGVSGGGTPDNRLPLDFISTHAYPTEVANGDDVDALASLLDDMRALVPSSLGLPIWVSEFNAGLYDWPIVGTNDSPFAAAFMVHNAPVLAARAAAAGGVPAVEGVSYWTFSDVFEELGFDETPFHNGYGLMTVQGVRKPAWRAFQILHALGNISVPTNVSSTGEPRAARRDDLRHHRNEDAVQPQPVRAFTTRNTTHAQVMLSNFQSPWRGWFNHSSDNWTVSVDVYGAGLPSTITAQRIDDTHANAYGAWVRMGSPKTLSPSQLSALHAASSLVDEAVSTAPCASDVAMSSLDCVRVQLDVPRLGVVAIHVPLQTGAAGPDGAVTDATRSLRTGTARAGRASLQ